MRTTNKNAARTSATRGTGRVAVLLALVCALLLALGCAVPGQDADPLPAAASVNEEQATEIALAHAGVEKDAATRLSVKTDRDDGVLHYDIEFIAGDTEYDYEVDAATGTVQKAEREAIARPQSAAAGATDSGDIGEDAAVEAACAHAGVKRDDISGLSARLDRDDGALHYDIRFTAGSTDYDYDIDAATGAVLQAEQEALPRAESDSAGDGDIGKDRAIEIALEHAGFSKSEVSGLRAERDREGSRTEYDIEFRVDRMEYEYEIDAATGKIRKSDKERDD